VSDILQRDAMPTFFADCDMSMKPPQPGDRPLGKFDTFTLPSASICASDWNIMTSSTSRNGADARSAEFAGAE